jgi:hypothetical protein
MQIDLEPYVSNSVKAGLIYIIHNLGGTRLASDTPEQTKEIAAFLQSSPQPHKHPYDAPQIRGAVRRTLADALGDAEPSEGKPRIVYLAGPLGSKQLLLDVIASPDVHSDAVKELRQLTAKSFRSDFRQLKNSFASHSGESLELYGKWRGLMSGMDQTLVAIADERRLNLLKDDTLVGFDAVDAAGNIDALKRNLAAGKDVHVYAVLLTSDEAEKEALKHGMSVREARTTAERFAEQWQDLARGVSNMTLFNSTLETVFKQRNNVVEIPFRPAGAQGGSAPLIGTSPGA